MPKTPAIGMATVSFTCPRDWLPDVPRILMALANDNIEIDLPVNLPGLLENISDLYIERALNQTSGNVTQAAKRLGLKRTTLVERQRRKNAVAKSIEK
jgi:DNA-binding NtrC family response regulator